MNAASFSITRRSMLSALALPIVSACTTPLPLVDAPAGQDEAGARLHESAVAHGLDAYRTITDINVSYAGEWRPLVNRIQPEVVDAGYRGSSQERLMPMAGVSAQSYSGSAGRKQVAWRREGGADRLGVVEVWYDGMPSRDENARRAAALVAEGYRLFLLGPLWLHERNLKTAMAGTERVNGRLCDVIDVWLRPGLGQVAQDRVAVCIDRVDKLTRRLRFTLEGFSKTQGAVAQVDTFAHERRFGVVWPMRSSERIVHPLSLPAHDWHITGLDVNRGYLSGDILGPAFSGAAARPATAL
jgi:hypothetical protein